MTDKLRGFSPEDRAAILASDDWMATPEQLAAELARLEAIFEADGGRGVELADRIDALRRALAR